jgi:hypothetical protein
MIEQSEFLKDLCKLVIYANQLEVAGHARRAHAGTAQTADGQNSYGLRGRLAVFPAKRRIQTRDSCATACTIIWQRSR